MLYLSGKRSNDLLKYKKFMDSEAKITDVTVDKNGEGVLVCYWPHNDVEFECKITGTHEERNYEKCLTYIGKWVNFKYQDTTKAKKPTFPVGNFLRDCNEKGNPKF